MADANTGWVAFRPFGLVVRIRERGGIERYSGTGWYAWEPKRRDIMAMDWRYGELDNVMAELRYMVENDPEGTA